MNIDALISEIDNVLGETSDGVPIHLIRRNEPEGDAIFFEKIARFSSAIERLAPPNSIHRRMCNDVLKLHAPPENSRQTVQRLKAILLALKEDLTDSNLRTTEEIIHGDVLSDMLDMARRMADDGFKDPAAVLAGSVLAEHLRRLCAKHGIILTTDYMTERIPKNVALMNEDLSRMCIYGKTEERNVNSWNEVRMKSLLGQNDKFTHDQANNMISGVRHLITTFPA